ncbi:F-box/LRR-repeat protein [Spatholobus suberectus]|nr:F-box/LRR-repeat protein [Spatholobus suberectus]
MRKTLKQEVMTPKRKPKLDSVYFEPGSAVEVNMDEDGFRGSWFSGTIIRRVISSRFLVEYHNLIVDEQSHKPLREVLNLHQLRPLPPPESHWEFKSGDKMDAFHNDGWWEGQVTEDLGNGRFGVYFSASEENMVFPTEKLRAHRKWINHDWVPPIINHKAFSYL